MINVNLKTLTATREQLPSNLAGLSQTTLENLQTELNPVPDELKNIVYWQEVDQSPTLNEYERYGDETLTVDQENKRVIVARAVVPWTAEEIAADMQAKAEQVKKDITTAVQSRLDAFAQTRNYDSILSACTYASSTVAQFAQEGQLCVNLRDATWGKLYQIMQEVEAGTRPMPASYADIESELPALAWA